MKQNWSEYITRIYSRHWRSPRPVFPLFLSPFILFLPFLLSSRFKGSAVFGCDIDEKSHQSVISTVTLIDDRGNVREEGLNYTTTSGWWMTIVLITAVSPLLKQKHMLMTEEMRAPLFKPQTISHCVCTANHLCTQITHTLSVKHLDTPKSFFIINVLQ